MFYQGFVVKSATGFKWEQKGNETTFLCILKFCFRATHYRSTAQSF